MGLVPEWVTDLKGWFQSIMNFCKSVDATAKKVWEWTLNHVWALVPVIVAAAKMVWDFIVQVAIRVKARFLEFDFESLRVAGSSAFASLSDVLAVANTFLPLDELFLIVTGLVTLWTICLVVRSIMKIKSFMFG